MRNLVLIVLFSGFLAPSFAGDAGKRETPPHVSVPTPLVEVTFQYLKQDGWASNQFAVWVENEAGNVVRTLYVTGFTAGRGGWKSRKHSLPVWVERSGVAGMTAEQIDAFTAATPGSGAFGRYWDCRDETGDRVPPGTYFLMVEGTLRSESRVLYKAAVDLKGGPMVIHPEPRYWGDHLNERKMIFGVEVRYNP